MDIQDKLEVRHIYNENGTQSRSTLFDLNKIEDNDIVFQFNEYETIEISVNSYTYEVGIECVSYLEESEIKYTQGNFLELENDKLYRISDNNQDKDINYIPAKYSLVIKSIDKEINSFFKVTYNKETSEEGMENIIEYINNFVRGLSIDFFRNVKINNLSHGNENNYDIVYEILSRNKNGIIRTTNILLGRLYGNINQIEEKENYEKKQNTRTLKLNTIKKNYTKIYNVKKKIKSNTNENIVLKYYLIKILKIYEKYIKKIEIIYKDNDDKIKQDEEKVEQNKKIEELQLSKFDKNNIKMSNKSINESIRAHRKWNEKINEWKKSYIVSVSYLKKLLNCSELKEININGKIPYSLTFNNDAHYSFFKKLYMQISSSVDNKHLKNSKSWFADKKSFVIFELYGFILIQNIFKELGFELLTDNKNIFTFTSDSIFKYVKDNISITVNYDHFCEKYTNENTKAGDIVNVNSRNCRPDYIISFIDSKKKINSILILEVKYRRKRYLYKKKGTTETDNTIDDYIQLAVKKEDGRRKYRGDIVSDVLILYPSKQEESFEHNNGVYVGINPMYDLDVSMGYKHLKEKIIDEINKII